MRSTKKTISVYDAFTIFQIIDEAYTEFFGDQISSADLRTTYYAIKRHEVPLWIHSWMRQHHMQFTYEKI